MADATTEEETPSKASVKKSGFPGRSQIGSKGPHVQALQIVLGVEATGKFGPETRQALMDKQEAKKVKATGVLTPEVWEVIS